MTFAKNIWLVLFILFSGNLLFAQNNIGVQYIEKNDKTEFSTPFKYHSLIRLIKLGNVSSNKINDKIPSVLNYESIAFNCDDLALFCRLELKMEKAVKFPVKFRIGEVQYVEQMEGKY